MQDWLGNQHTLDTSGWMGHDENSLQPTTTTKSLAPDHILNSVFATAKLLARKSVDATLMKFVIAQCSFFIVMNYFNLDF